MMEQIVPTDNPVQIHVMQNQKQIVNYDPTSLCNAELRGARKEVNKMDYKKRLVTALSIGSLMFSAILPGGVYADVNVDISGNGDSSNNTVNISSNNSVNVTQNNDTNISINVSSSANTGGNNANNNTGGNVTINTGNANSTVNISVDGSFNEASVTTCPCNSTVNLTVS